MKNSPITFTVPEIAEILRIGKTKAYDLVKSEDFPCVKIGNSIRIPREAFFAWMNKSVFNKAV